MQAIDTPSARSPSLFYWISLMLVPVVYLFVMTIVDRSPPIDSALLRSKARVVVSNSEQPPQFGKELPLVVVVGVDNQWGLEVGVYKRTFGQGTAETGTHWSKAVRFDKVAEGFGCQGAYVEKAEDLGPAIERAFASGKPTVIHVPIDPKANSEEMPKYERFRTWYAEGTQ